METATQDSTSKRDAPQPWVLVVDDDAEMRAYLREGLAGLPLRVEEASDGREALIRIQGMKQGKPALVITDIVMPVLDGLALKAALQGDALLSGVPVLLISGESMRARDGPVLRKPFNTRRLHAAVRALLEP